MRGAEVRRIAGEVLECAKIEEQRWKLTFCTDFGYRADAMSECFWLKGRRVQGSLDFSRTPLSLPTFRADSILTDESIWITRDAWQLRKAALTDSTPSTLEWIYQKSGFAKLYLTSSERQNYEDEHEWDSLTEIVPDREFTKILKWLFEQPFGLHLLAAKDFRIRKSSDIKVSH